MVRQNHGIAEETSEAVDQVIGKYVADFDESISELPRRRMGHPRLRDLSIRLGYALAGGEDWREVIPVCVAYELENCSSYLINWIFDEKGGEKTKLESDNLITAGMLLRELADVVLRDNGFGDLTPSINEIQVNGYKGQFADNNRLKVENLEEFCSYEDYLREYEQRCEDLSGYFYGHCLLSGSRVAGNEKPVLFGIGKTFGAGLQASNDVGDFALPNSYLDLVEKPYSDQFSDLRQGKLTLPVYLLLTKTDEETGAIVRDCVGKDLSLEKCGEIVEVFRATGGLDDSIAYLREKRKLAKKKLYDNFDRSEARDRIGEMFSAITSNKFLAHLKNLRGDDGERT
ncbi:MAG: hypothetical protein ABIG28_03015 [archaeon]